MPGQAYVTNFLLHPKRRKMAREEQSTGIQQSGRLRGSPSLYQRQGKGPFQCAIQDLAILGRMSLSSRSHCYRYDVFKRLKATSLRLDSGGKERMA